jgi:hypothetical protein
VGVEFIELASQKAKSGVPAGSGQDSGAALLTSRLQSSKTGLRAAGENLAGLAAITRELISQKPGSLGTHELCQVP